MTSPTTTQAKQSIYDLAAKGSSLHRQTVQHIFCSRPSLYLFRCVCPLIQRLRTTWENACNYSIKYSKPKHVYCNIASVSDSVVLTQPLSQIKCPCKSEIRLYRIINIAGFYCVHSFGVLKSRHGPNSFPSTIILETANPRPKDTCGDQCANCTYLRDVARHKLTISNNFHEKFYCCKSLDSAQQFNTTSTNLFAWCTTADPAKSTNPICWSHPFPQAK